MSRHCRATMHGWAVVCILDLLMLSSSQTAEVDGRYEDVTLTKLAFGSCSKQWKNQSLWGPIIDFQPQVWLWIGDAVYVKEEEGKSLRSAYSKQLKNPGYQRLINSSTIVDGVYDDHDYGVNDGDGTTYLPIRRDAFLDFLGHIDDSSPRRKRRGLYSAHVFGRPPHQAKILLLDTRSYRDPPALDLPRLLNLFKYPVKPFALALTRWIGSMMGITRKYEGDMLGEEQWKWLDGQLKGSEAAVHILVSTVQVFSTNPVIEGWGHFPNSRKRLINLLNLHKPRGLTILSGDVHFAELLNTQPLPGDTSVEPIEVTSSGMTHTCSHTALGMCQLAMETYDTHRTRPDTYYGGFNFGTIELEWEDASNAEVAAVQPTVQYIVKVRNKRGIEKLRLEKSVGPDDVGQEIGEPYGLSDNAIPFYASIGLIVAWNVLVLLICRQCWRFLTRQVGKHRSKLTYLNRSINGVHSNGVTEQQKAKKA